MEGLAEHVRQQINADPGRFVLLHFGQIRVAKRLWFWVEMSRTDFEALAVPSEAESLRASFAELRMRRYHDRKRMRSTYPALCWCHAMRAPQNQARKFIRQERNSER